MYTTLDILNSVSKAVIQQDASDTLEPSKSYILEKVNQNYFDICNKYKDWLFLNSTLTTIEGFTRGSDTSAGTGTHASNTNRNVGALQEETVIQPVSFTSNATIIKDMKFYLSADQVDLLKLNGYIQAKLYSGTYSNLTLKVSSKKYVVNNGEIIDPDDNTVTLGTITYGYLTGITFDMASELAVESGDYFLGLTITPDPVANGGVRPEYDSIGSGTSYVVDPTGITTLSQNVRIDYTAVYGTFSDELIFPTNVSSIFRIYDADDNDWLLRGDRKDGVDIKAYRFIIKSMTDGKIKAVLPTGDGTNIYWNAEVILTPTTLEETDTPLIPEAYKSLLVYSSVIDLLLEGYGLMESKSSAVMQEKFNSLFVSMANRMRQVAIPQAVDTDAESDQIYSNIGDTNINNPVTTIADIKGVG